MKFRLIAILVLVPLGLIGCTTNRSSIPEISEPQRVGLELRQPLLISVLDSRSEKPKSKAVVSALENGITNAYGSAVKLVPYYDQAPDDHVIVRIRLMANSANFGSRVISSMTINNSINTARATTSDFWRPVITVATEQSSVSHSFTTEGWWVGTSWLEIELEDTRFDTSERITVPIVAEEKVSNTFGYRSARKASERSWSLASQQLFRLMDSLIIALRDQEY
jgi:hypothetical protein